MAPDQPRGTQSRPLVQVDGDAARAPGTTLTGAELLSLAGRDAAAVDLYAEGSHGRRIEPQDTVDVQEGSRFVTREKHR